MYFLNLFIFIIIPGYIYIYIYIYTMATLIITTTHQHTCILLKLTVICCHLMGSAKNCSHSVHIGPCITLM